MGRDNAIKIEKAMIDNGCKMFAESYVRKRNNAPGRQNNFKNNTRRRT